MLTPFTFTFVSDQYPKLISRFKFTVYIGSVPWSETQGRRQNLTIDMAQNLLLSSGIADNVRNSSIETPTNNEKLHKCDQCNYSSFYKGNLYRHMRHMKHNPEKILNCDKCKFTSFDVVELKKHTRKHKISTSHQFTKCGQLTKCDQCNFSSIYPTSLTKHIRRHNPEKFFKCDQCSYEGNQRPILESHIRSTHQDLWYHCEECDFKTSQTGNLKTHVCSVKFKTWASQTNHT